MSLSWPAESQRVNLDLRHDSLMGTSWTLWLHCVLHRGFQQSWSQAGFCRITSLSALWTAGPTEDCVCDLAPKAPAPGMGQSAPLHALVWAGKLLAPLLSRVTAPVLKLRPSHFLAPSVHPAVHAGIVSSRCHIATEPLAKPMQSLYWLDSTMCTRTIAQASQSPGLNV